MPITDEHLEAIDEAAGTSIVDPALSGRTSPNGMNLAGAANRIRTLAQDQQDWERGGITGTPEEKAEMMAEAQEDFQYYLDVLHAIAEDLQGQDDSIEVGGAVVDLPRQASRRGIADEMRNRTDQDTNTSEANSGDGEQKGIIETILDSI